MNPGNIVINKFGVYSPLYDVIHGAFVAEFSSSEI